MATGVSIVFGTIVPDVSNILTSPIRSGGRVKGLADGKEVSVEKDEDDSEKSCQFGAIEQDEEDGDRNDEHGIDEKGEYDEEVVEQRG